MSTIDYNYNDLLYVKAQQEYLLFIDDLVHASTQEVIDRTYEKTIKQELVSMFDEQELPQSQAEALYKADNVLDKIYKNHIASDSAIRVSLDKTIIATAEQELQNNNSPETISQPEATKLATRLVEFYSNFDFYNYQDNLEVGETQKDAEEKIESQLHSKSAIKHLISNLEDMQHYGGLTHKKMSEADSLIEELETLSHKFDKPILPNQVMSSGMEQTM